MKSVARYSRSKPSKSKSKPVVNNAKENIGPRRLRPDAEYVSPRIFSCSFESSGKIQFVEEDQNDTMQSGQSAGESICSVPVNEFLLNFRESAAELVTTVYLSQSHSELNRSFDNGLVSIPLPEDIFTLVETQLILLDEYLVESNLVKTDEGDAVFINATLSVLRTLQWKQEHFRQSFLTDFERCLACANGWSRMGDMTENLLADLRTKYSHLGWEAAETKERLSEWDISVSLMEAQIKILIDLYTQDSFHAVKCAVMIVMKTVWQSEIPSLLFSVQWEDDLIQNEVATSLVRTFDDYITDMRQSLESYLFEKAVASFVRATVCFYIQCLVIKADRVRPQHPSNRNRRRPDSHAFRSPNRSVTRIRYDIEVFNDYFQDIVQTNGAMKCLVTKELSVLTLMLEFMAYAAGQSETQSLESFVLVVHKCTGADSMTTRTFLSDIYILFDRTGSKTALAKKTVNNMKTDLVRVTERVKEKTEAFGVEKSSSEMESTSFQLDAMLKVLYEERMIQEKARLCGRNLEEDELSTFRIDFQRRFEQFKIIFGIL